MNWKLTATKSKYNFVSNYDLNVSLVYLSAYKLDLTQRISNVESH